jgi:hypothetical protein
MSWAPRAPAVTWPVRARCGSAAASPDQTSAYAEEGRLAHLLAELCLSNRIDAIDVNNTEAASLGIDPETLEAMRPHVQTYLDYCRAFVDTWSPDLVFIEEWVDLDPWIPGGFGTVDFGVIDTLARRLHVIDLKYGAGVPVSAVGNPQTRTYGLGLLLDLCFLYDIDQVVLHIVQPRLDSISTETLKVTDLLNWGHSVLRPGVQAALQPDAPLVPGLKQCFFCRARKVCPARASANQAQARRDFDGTLIPPEVLSLADIAALLPHLDELRRWATDVQDYALAQAEQGRTVPGYKLVAGRSNRAWTGNETDTIDALLDLGLAMVDVTTSKLVGIPAIEKVLGGAKHAAHLLEPLITKPVGKPALVPDADPRPALSSASSARSDFAG